MNEGVRRNLASAAAPDPPQTYSAAAPTAGRASRIGKLLRAGVSIGLILLLAWIVDWNRLAAVVARADLPLLGLASLTVLADRAMMIGKWYPLLRVQGLDIPFAHAARVYFAATFASLFLPTSVGADVLRTLALGADRRATLEVGASIVVERMLGLAASVLLCTLVLSLALWQAFALAFLLPWILGFGCALLGMTFLVLRPGWWRALSPIGSGAGSGSGIGSPSPACSTATTSAPWSWSARSRWSSRRSRS